MGSEPEQCRGWGRKGQEDSGSIVKTAIAWQWERGNAKEEIVLEGVTGHEDRKVGQQFSGLLPALGAVLFLQGKGVFGSRSAYSTTASYLRRTECWLCVGGASAKCSIYISALNSHDPSLSQVLSSLVYR